MDYQSSARTPTWAANPIHMPSAPGVHTHMIPTICTPWPALQFLPHPWGSGAEPTPDKRREPQERGCPAGMASLRSPEISSGRGGAYVLCQSGGLLLPGGIRPQVTFQPTLCPWPRSLGYLDPSVPLLSGPPCQEETLEGRALGFICSPACPSLEAAQQSLPTATRGLGKASLPSTVTICQPPSPLCLLSLRLSAQDRRPARPHVPPAAMSHSGGHGYCASILPSTAPGPQVRALATARAAVWWYRPTPQAEPQTNKGSVLTPLMRVCSPRTTLGLGPKKKKQP